MARKFDEGDADILPILKEAGRYVLARRLQFPDVASAAYQRQLRQIHDMVGLSVRALLEVRSIAQDMRLITQMLKRYPWHGTGISRSKHLEFSWFLFVNFCYLFEEKVKRFYEQTSRIKKFFDKTGETSLQTIGFDSKRHRFSYPTSGDRIHQWGLPHNAINFYSMIEMLARTGHEQSIRTRKEHLSHSRFFLKQTFVEPKNVWLPHT